MLHDLHVEFTRDAADLDLDTPKTLDNDYATLEELGNLASASSLYSGICLETIESLGGDVWSFPASIDTNFAAVISIKDWDNNRLSTSLLTQDDSRTDTRGPDQSLKHHEAINCLVQMVLGRESDLYRFSEEDQVFKPAKDGARAMELSSDNASRLIARLIDCGSKLRKLTSSIKSILATAGFCPSLIAVAKEFTDIFANLQSLVGGTSAADLRTLPQLQSSLERPCVVIEHLDDMLHTIWGLKHDEQVLSAVFRYALESEHTIPWLRPLNLQIFASASRPWLETLSNWLGLNSSPIFQSHSFDLVPDFLQATEIVRKSSLGKDIIELTYSLNHALIPDFITQQDAEDIVEIGKSLRLLAYHQPQHLLVQRSSPDVIQAPFPKWGFSWKQVEDIKVEAEQYEKRYWTVIGDWEGNLVPPTSANLSLETGVKTVLRHERTSKESAKAYVDASKSIFERPWREADVQEVSSLLDFTPLFDESATQTVKSQRPSLSHIPLLSLGPLVTAQARLVGNACVHLLFQEHDFRGNLALLHRFSLFGDGGFANRLSRTLFDADSQPTTRGSSRSYAGTPGLASGSRMTWPPANPEIRLALTDILAESELNQGHGQQALPEYKDLTGVISFSIREMTEEGSLLRMNPDSIEAFDFLKLDYKPPAPLVAVISQTSLEAYDAAFKLLLRCRRMLCTVNQIWRDMGLRSSSQQNLHSSQRCCNIERRFSAESRHFVLAMSQYFSSGIQMRWDILQRELDKIEASLDQTSDESLPGLCSLHDRVLADIMLSLLLRKEQAQSMQLLEQLFDQILRFARYIRLQRMPFAAMNHHDDPTAEIARMYEEFGNTIRRFIKVCQRFAEKRAQTIAGSDLSWQGNSDERQSDPMNELILALDLNAYYTRQ